MDYDDIPSYEFRINLMRVSNGNRIRYYHIYKIMIVRSYQTNSHFMFPLTRKSDAKIRMIVSIFKIF